VGRRLRVLVVEDVEDDAILMVRELEREGFAPEWRRVESAEALEAALAGARWDVVLADYRMGGFTALDALRIVQRYDPDLPVIVVSGTAGDREAVEVMRAGARDYFHKDRIRLLAPAVERELRESAARRARREAEARLHLVTRALEASAAVVVITDRGGTIEWVNPAFSKLTGYAAEEAVGRHMRTLGSRRHPDGFPREMLRSILSGETWHGEVINRRKDGTLYTAEITITPVRDEAGEITHFVAVTEDVTDRRRLEEALRESEARFRLAFETSPDPMTITRMRDGVYVAVNRAAERALGVPCERLLGRTILELGFWADPRDRERFVAALQATGTVRDLEARFRVGGGVRDAMVSAAVFELGGEPHIFAVVKDLTERKRMERALRESEERYRRFFELGLTANYIAAGDRIVDCNGAFVEMFGFASKEEALATPVSELYLRPAARRRFLERLRRERVIRGERMEYRRRDGTPLRVLEAAVGVFEGGGELAGVQGFMVDLSEREELERRLLQAQRMEPVGRLAAGVAHDFNNILQAISTQLELLRMVRADDPEVARRTGEVQRAVERGARLTRQLLAFSRQEAGNPRPLDLGQLVGDLMKMLRRLVGEDLELVLREPGGALPVVADPGQLEQVVMNLVVNARDATPPGGRITIALRRIEPDGEFRATRPWAVAPAYVVLEVADTGCGMPPEVLERAFEPFFTTKEPGRGTGLGLATVYGIVTEHGGMAEAASEPGKGSVFTVYLPLAEPPEAATEDGEREEDTAVPRGRGELVLLAEDDRRVREAMVEALEAIGYRVLAAADGRQALERFRRHAGEVRLAVLDVLMPGVTGDRVASAIRRQRPDLPILFLSGYPGETLSERVEFPEGTRVLRKPLALRDLVREVQAALPRVDREGGR